jgi:hypothetical protein
VVLLFWSKCRMVNRFNGGSQAHKGTAMCLCLVVCCLVVRPAPAARGVKSGFPFPLSGHHTPRSTAPQKHKRRCSQTRWLQARCSRSHGQHRATNSGGGSARGSSSSSSSGGSSRGRKRKAVVCKDLIWRQVALPRHLRHQAGGRTRLRQGSKGVRGGEAAEQLQH